MTHEPERRALMDAIYEQFGVKLLWYENFKSSCCRDDVSVHGFFSLDDTTPTEQAKREIRRWVENRGWQFSRQWVNCEVVPGRTIEYFYLAPRIPVELDVGYHATRLVSVPAIQAIGLLPSATDRQTTERGDCEGNIYISKVLGMPTDTGVRGRQTAHWWCDHLARKNRFNDHDWVILEIDVHKVRGARLYKDIWSESGIIVGGVDVIPPNLIRVVCNPAEPEAALEDGGTC